MRLQGLLQPLQENDKFITAINSIKNKKFPINISGLSDSGKSYIIGELLLTRIWKFAILKVNTKYLEPL